MGVSLTSQSPRAVAKHNQTLQELTLETIYLKTFIIYIYYVGRTERTSIPCQSGIGEAQSCDIHMGQCIGHRQGNIF